MGGFTIDGWLKRSNPALFCIRAQAHPHIPPPHPQPRGQTTNLYRGGGWKKEWAVPGIIPLA